ncbi:MAG TPA: alpha/beta hydrolase [Candidatus Cryptobacteroides pullicola]|nr:alpha/beta hydrolase [Candidatus Cryptobacteroides pullicola]
MSVQDPPGPVLEGPWSGKISAGQTELTLVFNFAVSDDGSLSVTLDSPDQGAEGIEAECDATALPMLRVNIPSLLASYSGIFYGRNIVGTFSQGGLSLPLTLTEGEPRLLRPQTPRPPYPYAAEDVSFPGGDTGVVLAGTITYPAGYTWDAAGDSSRVHHSRAAAPVAVVMVSGSGLQDRDEQIFGHRPFLVIADFLARNGIASLRYDDRGFGESTGAETVGTATTEDFMQDALAAVGYLRSTGRFSRIGVLGHSEGANIAFMLGALGKADFVISLAGIGVRGDEALAAQANRILELSGQKGDIGVETYRRSVLAQNQPWLSWFIDYDPTADISGTACPVMAVNGSLDSQVIPSLNLAAIAEKLPEGSADGESGGKNFVKEYASLNHLFQHCTTGAPTEYRGIEETMSEELLADIAAWIREIGATASW